MADAPGPPATPAVVGLDHQDEEPVDVERWVALATAALVEEGVAGPAELTLVFVDEAEMAVLNGTHLGKEGPTDVLAFPIDPPGGPPDHGTPPGASRMLGDVVICPRVARRNAPGHAGTYDDELALLTVHGVLHVLGHDHAEAAEAAAMQRRERELLARFHRS